MNNSRGDITVLVEEVKHLNPLIQNHYQENDTFTKNSSEILNLNGFSTSIFLLDGYIISILAPIGFALNILGICFLSNGSRRKKIYSIFLSTLFGLDAFFLLF